MKIITILNKQDAALSSSPPLLRKLSSQDDWKRYRSVAIPSTITESQFESSIFDSGPLNTIATSTSTIASPTSSRMIDYDLSNEADGYDEFEVDYLQNGEYTDDKYNAEVARYNLATRVMSNGVEVIIAGDKSKTVEQNNIHVDNTNNNLRNSQKSNILRILQSQSQKPMTLAPSTLQDQMILVDPSNIQENYAIPIDTNHFITKTCLTTYTYRTTYLQNGQTTIESREKVISNIATEERNYLKLSPTHSLGVTLSRTPEFAVGVFPTTYTYYNTIFDGELPIVVTSKHTLSNTITGPDDYISFIQPSEAATPVLETNTYYKEIMFTKTWRESDSSEQIISTANLLTQVVVTESLPSRSTSVMTSYFAFDALDTQQEYLLPQNGSIHLRTAATELHSSLSLYHSSSGADEGELQLLQTPLTKKATILSTTTTLPGLLDLDSNQDYDLHIYATKTFLTTFTYFTTMLLKSPTSANLVISSTQGLVPSPSSTVVNYHTRVIENVITETIPSSLLGTNLLSRFYVELKKSKNQRKVIVTQATLSGGQTLEITAMKIQKPGFATTSLGKQNPASVNKNTKPLSVTKASKVNTINSNLKQSTAAPVPATIHSNKSNEIDAADADDSIVASSEQELTYVSTSGAKQPSKPLKDARPITSSLSSANNGLVKNELPPGRPPPNGSNLPGTVNQIIGSFNLQRLTALRPVFNAMAGLLNNNFGIGGTTADTMRHPTTKHPIPHPQQVESKHALKNITASNNYETNGYNSYAERPIYIPVQNLVTLSTTPNHLGNISNASSLLYYDDKSLYPSQLTPPQSLHIQPPAADVVLSNENWFQEAASKLLPPPADHISAATDLKSHKSASTFETPLLNGGIPISPGEVITANSDVIIGRPNGIQHPRVPLNSKSAEISPEQPPNDSNIAATNHVLSQLADVPYTTFYQHFIQHPHPPPYKKKSALPNVSQKVIPFKEHMQSTIPINANFNESILKPPPFIYSNEHQTPPELYAKTYAVASPPSYIQLPPPPPAQHPLNRQKTNQKQYLQQHHLLYIPQGYSETKYFSRLTPEINKFYNFNKELQNNEILEIQRIPEVFSTDLPPETEFTASYLTTQRPLEAANENTGEVHVQLGHAANPNLLMNVQPTRITNIVIPPHDNAASALVLASTSSMVYNHQNAQYYDAATVTAGTSTPIPTLKPLQQSSNSQASTNHQEINFDMNVFSHNVDINVPPLTFKKDADEFPPSSAPVLGQISTKQMGAPLNLHKMPLVKIPLNEAQVQVELTPQQFIGSVIESNHQQPSGIFKQAQKHQLIMDNSAIGSFALEPQFRGTPPTTSKHQHQNANLKPERQRVNNNEKINSPYNSHVTIQENPFSMKMNKVSPVAAVNNFGMKLEQSNSMLSSPPTLMESYASSNNFGLRNKPLASASHPAVEYAIRSEPYPPRNIEEVHSPTYQQHIEPKLTNKKQRHPSLGPVPLNMNAHLSSYLPTNAPTPKPTVMTKLTTPPNYTRNTQQTSAADYWNHNFVTDDNDNDAVTNSLKDGTASISDQKVEASLNSLRLSQQQQQQHKESDNSGVKPYKNKWPILNDMSIREVNNMPNLVTSPQLTSPSSPSSHINTILPTADSNKTRSSESYNQIHKLPTQGKPFKAIIQTETTSFPKRHQPTQKIFVTSGEGFKHKVAVGKTTTDTHQVTSKYAENPNTLSLPAENNDGDDEIFDYYETSNVHNFESINTTANVIDYNTTSKATPTTNAYSKRPLKDNSYAVTSSTTRNNKNNGLYPMLTPNLNIHPPPPPPLTAIKVQQQQSQANEAVFGLSPPPPPQSQAPATLFSLPTIPYKTINYTSNNNDLQRLSLQPPPPPKLNQNNSPAPTLKTKTRQPSKRPAFSKPPKVLASNLTTTTPAKNYNNENPQHMQTPMLSSTPFAISTSINFIPRLGQMDSTRIRFQLTETPHVDKSKSKTSSVAPISNSASKPIYSQLETSAQTTKSSQQLHDIKPTVVITTRTTTISNSVKPSKILLSSSGNNVKNQHRANTQLLPRLPPKQIILPTKFITNTQVLTVTTTKTTVLTTAGKQSTKTLTFTKTQTATILDTVTEIQTLLQPTRVTESHIILATTTVPVPVHVPVSVTVTAAGTALTTVSTHDSDDNNPHDLGSLSNHKPYENHTHKSAFDVDESKFNGIAHPSIEVVLPDAVNIQKQQKVTTEKATTTSSKSNNTANNSIFIVMTDSTSKTGNKKNIININPSMLESPHEINGISVLTADTTSSGAGLTAADTTGGTYIADSNIPLDYYDNVSFDFPTLDEEPAPNANKENHVLLGGVLIATPPKSSSSPRKPMDSTTKKQNVNNALLPNQNASLSVVGSTPNAVCHPTCKASRNELCMRVQQTSTRCVCRPGFARMFPDRPCKPTYTYSMQIRLHRIGKDLLNFDEYLPNNESEQFRELAAITHDAVDRMVMQSDFRDVYHGVHLTSFEIIKNQGRKDETAGNESVANFLLQLSDNSDDKRLANVFKKYLRQNNYSIGGTELYTTKDGVESMAVVDFDECIHSKFHDCSENARCFNLQGTYTCSCQEGYADLSENPIYPGRLCSAEMIGCEMCHYHGKCMTFTNNNNSTSNKKEAAAASNKTPICECFPWYTGATCQLNLKILLIALIATGTLLFILLLFCILVTCTKRNRHHNARSVLASSMHKLAVKNSRLTPTVGGMRSKNIKIDKRAMIKDSSSETSQNSLPYVLKEQTGSIKKQHAHHFPASIYYDGNHSNHPSSSMHLIHHQGNEQIGAVTSTLITALEHSINELQHYPEQTDRSLTVMIPRAKYHPTVLPSTQLLHHQLAMDRKPHEQNKATINRAIPGSGMDDLHANPDAEHMQLSSNAMSVDPKKPANTNKRTSVSSQRNGGLHTSNTSAGALISAGFEVSATVSGKLLNNTSNALNSSSVTTNDSVSARNGDGNKRYDNASTNNVEAMPPGADADLYSAGITSSANEMHHHQILPNYMAEIHLRGSKTEVSESHDSEYNTNYRDGADLIDSMDVWLDTMHQTELASEARSFDETTVHAPTKSMRSCFGNQNSQPNDEANTMAERDIGSTFLLPHTHLYKPDRHESDMSGFDSV